MSLCVRVYFLLSNSLFRTIILHLYNNLFDDNFGKLRKCDTLTSKKVVLIPLNVKSMNYSRLNRFGDVYQHYADKNDFLFSQSWKILLFGAINLTCTGFLLMWCSSTNSIGMSPFFVLLCSLLVSLLLL